MTRNQSAWPVGLRIEKTAGVYLTGTVVAFVPRVDYTDGSYTEPLPHQRREAVYVQWDDGTQGWSFKRYLRALPSTHPNYRRPVKD